MLVTPPRLRLKSSIRPASVMPLLALLLSLSLFGCSSPPPPATRFPDITFQQYPKINFTVGRIEIVRDYVPPLHAPNVEHLFPASPMQVAERWAKDRLNAVGGPGEVRYVIKRASVVETNLPRTTGIRGAFTNDQTQRYDAVVEVELEIRNERGYRDGIVTARADRRQSVAEDSSPADRERAWFAMTEALAHELNDALDSKIHSELQRFIASQ